MLALSATTEVRLGRVVIGARGVVTWPRGTVNVPSAIGTVLGEKIVTTVTTASLFLFRPAMPTLADQTLQNHPSIRL